MINSSNQEFSVSRICNLVTIFYSVTHSRKNALMGLMWARINSYSRGSLARRAGLEDYDERRRLRLSSCTKGSTSAIPLSFLDFIHLVGQPSPCAKDVVYRACSWSTFRKHRVRCSPQQPIRTRPSAHYSYTEKDPSKPSSRDAFLWRWSTPYTKISLRAYTDPSTSHSSTGTCPAARRDFGRYLPPAG